MSARTFDGMPLTPAVNVDAVSMQSGLERAEALGYVGSVEDQMVVEYALTRHARGEEDGAEQTWMSHFGKRSFTDWRVVLASAVATPACLLCRGPLDDPDDHLCPGCRDDQDSAVDERLRAGRHHNAWTPSVLDGPPYRVANERGSTEGGFACALGLFVAFVLVFAAPAWLIALAVLIPAAWLIGAALWDLFTAPREDPYLSDWDVRSSHTPDRKRVTR